MPWEALRRAFKDAQFHPEYKLRGEDSYPAHAGRDGKAMREMLREAEVIKLLKKEFTRTARFHAMIN